MNGKQRTRKNQNAKNYISQSGLSFDIIFIDPPYNSDLLQQCLTNLRNTVLVNEHTLLYIEYKVLPDLIGYQMVKEGKAGAVRFALIKTDIVIPT
jgi:16S rRNA (guanine966-N2)-methyltransferase